MGYAQSVWTNRREAPGMQRVRGREMEQKNEWEAIGGWDISTLYAIIHIFRIHHLAKCGSAPYAWYHGCHCHCLFPLIFSSFDFSSPLSLSISLPLPLSPFFFFPSLLPHAKNLMNRHRIIFCLFPSPEKFARSHSTCSKLHSLLQKCEAFVFVILRVSWWVFFSSIVSLFSYIFLVCLVFSLISFLVFFNFPWFCRKIVSDNLYYAAPSYLLSLD